MKLLFTGDLYYNYPEIREDIRELGDHFREKGCRLIPNLEGGVGNPENKRIWKRGSCIKQDPCISEVLNVLNTKGVTLANNHMMDFGEKGLSLTLGMLDKGGFLHTGAGRDIEAALSPMEIEDGGRTAAIFNFGWDAEETVYAGSARPGCAPRDGRLILKVIRDYADKNPETDVIVVLHWGFERNLYPMPFDISLGHALLDIDSVKLVIGHHPHCPQPVEEYRGKRIYYSLGNFYFGKSRIKYSEKIYDHDPRNMSDYGIGVIYDTENGETGDMVFCYESGFDRTLIKSGTGLPEKMPDYGDFRQYEGLIRRTRLSNNPVLGTSGFLNSWKVFLYNSARNLHRLGILR